MPYPVFAAGQRVTAGMLSAMQWQEVVQGSSQIVNNSTTLVDTNLVVPVEAGAVYMFRLLMSYICDNAVADIKFAWSVPGGGVVDRWTWGAGPDGTGGAGNFTDVSFRRPGTATAVTIGTGNPTTYSYHEEGQFVGGDGGDIILQFAQDVATAVDTEITASSRIRYLRVG